MVDQASRKDIPYMSDTSQGTQKTFELQGKQAHMHKPLQNHDNDYLSNFITQMYNTTSNINDSLPKIDEDGKEDQEVIATAQLNTGHKDGVGSYENDEVRTHEERKSDMLNENDSVQRKRNISAINSIKSPLQSKDAQAVKRSESIKNAYDTDFVDRNRDSMVKGSDFTSPRVIASFERANQHFKKSPPKNQVSKGKLVDSDIKIVTVPAKNTDVIQAAKNLHEQISDQMKSG